MATTTAEHKEVAHLQKEIDELRKQLEDFMAKFGTHYNSEGYASLFVVDELTRDGANGLALTARQGVIEQFGLPLKLKKKEADEKKEGPYWVPMIIPKRLEAVVLSDGTDNKASD
jgi:hypothetical protein